MHRVTGAFGNDVAKQRTPDQRQVSYQVERLVPAALVGEAESAWISTPLRVKQIAESSDAPRINPSLSTDPIHFQTRTCAPAKARQRNAQELLPSR